MYAPSKASSSAGSCCDADGDDGIDEEGRAEEDDGVCSFASIMAASLVCLLSSGV